jgi:TM2 domain-containing membrane protein YozV
MAERERIERERIEAERADAEKLAREKLAKADTERVERERLEAEAKLTNAINDNAGFNDLIMLLNGNEIKVKIMEINSAEIKYKRADYLDGPTITVNNSEVYALVYKNGTHEIINAPKPAGNEQKTVINTQSAVNEQKEVQNIESSATNPYQNQPIQDSNYRYRSPSLAWLFSFLTPGVGQFYNGDVGKGVAFLVTCLTGSVLVNVGMNIQYDSYGNTSYGDTDAGMLLAGVAVYLASWTWSQIDAPVSANKKNSQNRSNAGLSWELGNGNAYLSVEPDFKITPVHVNQSATLTPTYGMGVKIKF